VFFENKAPPAKTNHIRLLVPPTPTHVQNMKEIDFQLLPPNARCLLKVALNQLQGEVAMSKPFSKLNKKITQITTPTIEFD